MILFVLVTGANVFIMRYLCVTLPVTARAYIQLICHISSAILSKRDREMYTRLVVGCLTISAESARIVAVSTTTVAGRQIVHLFVESHIVHLLHISIV